MVAFEPALVVHLNVRSPEVCAFCSKQVDVLVPLALCPAREAVGARYLERAALRNALPQVNVINRRKTLAEVYEVSISDDSSRARICARPVELENRILANRMANLRIRRVVRSLVPEIAPCLAPVVLQNLVAVVHTDCNPASNVQILASIRARNAPQPVIHVLSYRTVAVGAIVVNHKLRVRTVDALRIISCIAVLAWWTRVQALPVVNYIWVLTHIHTHHQSPI